MHFRMTNWACTQYEWTESEFLVLFFSHITNSISTVIGKKVFTHLKSQSREKKIIMSIWIIFYVNCMVCGGSNKNGSYKAKEREATTFIKIDINPGING